MGDSRTNSPTQNTGMPHSVVPSARENELPRSGGMHVGLRPMRVDQDIGIKRDHLRSMMSCSSSRSETSTLGGDTPRTGLNSSVKRGTGRSSSASLARRASQRNGSGSGPGGPLASWRASAADRSDSGRSSSYESSGMLGARWHMVWQGRLQSLHGCSRKRFQPPDPTLGESIPGSAALRWSVASRAGSEARIPIPSAPGFSRVRHLADARDGAASRRLSQSCTCSGERYPGRGRIRSCRDSSAYSAGRAGTDGPPGQMEGNRWPSPPTFIPPRLQTPGRTRGAPSRGSGRTDPDSSGVGTRRPVRPHLSCGSSPDGAVRLNRTR